MKSLILIVVVATVFANVENDWFKRCTSRGFGKDGTMDKDHWKNCFMHHFDFDDDGNITWHEFNLEYHQADLDNKDQALRVFLEFDRNDNDMIDPSDLDHLFNLLDEDGNTQMDYDEFKRGWKGLTQS